MTRTDWPCCCDGCSCQDCLHGVDLGEGCCHSNLCGKEILVLRKNRPGHRRDLWSACSASNPDCIALDSSVPCTSEGCEMRATVTTDDEEPIQAIYNPKGSYFNVIGGKFAATDPWKGLNHYPRYCNDTCTTMAAKCCHGDDLCDEDCLEDCECYGSQSGQAPTLGGPNMSPYMKSKMEDDDQYASTLGILCYNGGADSLGSPPTAEDPDVGSGTGYHLFDGYLGHVFLEFWWERAQCDGWFLPDPLCEPRDCGAGTCVPIGSDASGEGQLGISNIVPRYWFFGCSGVPIFAWTIARARDNGDITSTECVDLLGQLGATSSGSYGNPDQAILKKLWDTGYIRTSDWRGDLNSAWTTLSATFSAYSGCPETEAADLDAVGPVRILGDGITCADAASADSALQPSCCIDPWSGGPYPDPGDADYAAYETWRASHGLYMHARRGGWGWACWNVTESDIPFVGAARNNFDCLDTAGYPQDTCCEQVSCSGNWPSYCCRNPCDPEDTCFYPTTSCTPFTASLESCDSKVVRGFCNGCVVSRFIYEQEPYLIDNPGSDPYIAYKSTCGQVYHSVLQAIDNSCGEWSTPGELYECRFSDDGLGVYAEFPTEDDTHFAPMSYCDYIGSSSTLDGACCGGICADWDAPVQNGIYCPDIWGRADGCDAQTRPLADPEARDCIGERGACKRGMTCYSFMRQKDCAAMGGTYYSMRNCCEDEPWDPDNCVE